MDYDDVLNEQRSVIYEQRDTILADDKLSERIMNNARDTVEILFDEYEDAVKHARRDTAGVTNDLAEKIKNTFGVMIPAERLTKDSVLAELQNDITEKETHQCSPCLYRLCQTLKHPGSKVIRRDRAPAAF